MLFFRHTSMQTRNFFCHNSKISLIQPFSTLIRHKYCLLFEFTGMIATEVACFLSLPVPLSILNLYYEEKISNSWITLNFVIQSRFLNFSKNLKPNFHGHFHSLLFSSQYFERQDTKKKFHFSFGLFSAVNGF